jgi:hypothetical protein
MFTRFEIHGAPSTRDLAWRDSAPAEAAKPQWNGLASSGWGCERGLVLIPINRGEDQSTSTITGT